ncbi:MAG: molecular chaperone TorD family protein [Clostridiales Family XIII bacterium]|nr:molecular chaperone TorD family protein [Clostridiales Family XIII bacterium]
MNEAVAMLLRQRESLYRLLGGVYLEEPDAARLEAMKKMELPLDRAEGDLKEGYARLAAYLGEAGADAETVESIAADYAGTFLAAGQAQGLAAFPYESVYRDPGRGLGGVSGAETAALYREKGLEPDPGAFKIPSDHIGLELSFMAHLCRQAALALAHGNTANYLGYMGEQADFLAAHLFRWYRGFCDDARRCARTDFYRAFAGITKGFLEQEERYFEGGAGQWATE